jgi:SOS-response transcriptional repressor LexA
MGSGQMITTTPSTPPTERQAAVLDYIVRSMREHGRPPTVREISAEFGWNSPNGAMTHLLGLVRKGKLRPADGTARGYIPVGLVGCCPTCGRPFESNGETSPFSPHR